MAKVYVDDVKELIQKAGFIRSKLAEATRHIGNVHIGGPMSATDVAVALYYKHLGFDPEHLDDPERDTFILSKGHNGILLYTIFCDLGLYDFEYLWSTYNQIDGPFGAHPNRKRVKGIEVSTGSLGHGLSWSCGIAHANRNKGIVSRIWCLLGDGEMEEGSNWEALLYAASKKMDNIVAIVDFNNCSASFECGENIVWGQKGGAEGLADAMRSFGWEVQVIDGSDMAQIDEALSSLPPVTLEGKPQAIICNTIKGQGVQFMMDNPAAWHIGGFADDKLDEALEQIADYMARKLEEVN